MFEASNIGTSSTTTEPKKEVKDWNILCNFKGKKTKKDFKKIEKEGMLNIQQGGALGFAYSLLLLYLEELGKSFGVFLLKTLFGILRTKT